MANVTIDIEFQDCTARVMIRGENLYLQINGDNYAIDTISRAFIHAYIKKTVECNDLKEKLQTVTELYQAEVGELEC